MIVAELESQYEQEKTYASPQDILGTAGTLLKLLKTGMNFYQ